MTGHVYTVKSRATDKATNVEQNFVSGTNNVSFLYDNTIPTVAITNPVGEPATPRYSSLATITGTAADNVASNLNRVEVRVFRNDTSKYYNPLTLTYNLTVAQSSSAWFAASSADGYADWGRRSRGRRRSGIR